MKKSLIAILFLIILLPSCGVDKSKIVGTWNVSRFYINGSGIEKHGFSYPNKYEVKTIQFLENGFFILGISETTPDRPFDKLFKTGYTSLINYKGKWTLKNFSKIEFEFIDSSWLDIGLQSGIYKFNNNRLIIEAKGEKEFSSFDLYK